MKCLSVSSMCGSQGKMGNLSSLSLISVFFSQEFYLSYLCVCVYESVSITSQCARNKDLSNAFI